MRNLHLKMMGGLCAVLLSCAPSTSAGMPQICAMAPSQWQSKLASQLDGYWTVNSLAGALEMAGMTMPLPPSPGSHAAITAKPDGLYIADEQLGNKEFRLKWVSDKVWDLTPPKNAPVDAANVIDEEQMAVLIGCNQAAKLPRLYASGEYVGEEGKVRFETYLYVLGPDLMHGATVGHLNGGQGTARRIITLSK